MLLLFYEKGTKSDPGSYRPISLTSVACKLLESFVRDAVVEHKTDNSLYRLCVSQLLDVMEDSYATD